MRNWKPFLGLLLAFALVLTACGDDGAEETTAAPVATTAAPTTTAAPETTTTAAPETTTTAAPEETTTTTEPPVVRADADLVIWADDTRTPAIQTFADEFGAANGLTVAVQELGFGDIRDRLVTAAPTSSSAPTTGSVSWSPTVWWSRST